MPVVVTYSDDSVTAGEARVIGPRPLTLVPLGENRPRLLQLSDMVTLEQEIEKASMERPWTFKESGQPEKVYLEGEYPLINFKTRITQANGSVITGHLISAAISLKSGKGQQKLFLQRQIKGTKSEKLEDLVYIRSIRMTATMIEGGKNIRGDIKGFGKIISVTALDNERGNVLFARTTQDGNRFDFGIVLPGSYDLCVLTDTHALTGLSGAVPRDAAAPPLQESDLAAINKKFPLADDFFNDRCILRLSGNRAFAKALIYKRRADYHDAERWTPGGFLWHLEIWSWHIADTEWKVDRRFILIRHKQKGGEQNRILMTGNMLEAVTPGSELHIQSNGDNDATWRVIRNLD